MSSILDKLKSRSDEDSQRRQHQSAPQPAIRPAGVVDGVPTVSLDAAYVGTMSPEDVPRDGVVYVDPATYKAPAANTPLSDAQKAGLSVMAQLAGVRL